MSIPNRAPRPVIKTVSLSELLNTKCDYTNLSKKEAFNLIGQMVHLSKFKYSREQFKEVIKGRVEESNICISEMTSEETIEYLTTEIWNHTNW